MREMPRRGDRGDALHRCAARGCNRHRAAEAIADQRHRFADAAQKREQQLFDMARDGQMRALVGASPVEQKRSAIHLRQRGGQRHVLVEIEEWANEGEPLPYRAAKELIEDLFGRDVTGSAQWIGAETLGVPALHLTAEHDRIAPAASAPAGEKVTIPSGHVGMIVGSARAQLHEALRQFLRS
jgi:polyhydroxyalkanoate synthase